MPLIDVTDLYHTPQDPGDNFDIVTAYAMPGLDLKAVILDVTEALRTDRRLLTEAQIREGRGATPGLFWCSNSTPSSTAICPVQRPLILR